jgi:hypothetical protein
MKRAIRVLLVVVGIAVLFAATAAAMLPIVLPAFVERAAIAKLRELGFADVSLEIAGLSFRELRIRAFQAGPRFRAETIDVDFELRGLLRGRVERVHIVGARWEVPVGTSGVELAPFDALESGGAGADVPFDRLELASSELIVVHPEGRFHAPVELAAIRSAPGRIEISGELSSLALRALLELEPSGASLELDLRRGEPALLTSLDAIPDGRSFSLQARYQKRGAEQSAAASLSLDEEHIDRMLFGRRIEAARLRILLDAAFDLEARRVSKLELDTSVEHARAAGIELDHFSLAAAQRDHSIEWNAIGAGAGWRLARLSGSLPAELESWRAITHRLELSAQGDLAALSMRAEAERLGRVTLEGSAELHVQPFRLDAPLDVVLEPGALAMENITASGVRGRVELFARADGEDVSIALERGELRALSIHAGKVELENARLTLLPEPDLLTARRVRGRFGAAVHIGDVILPSPRVELTATLDEVHMKGSWTLGEGAAVTASGMIDLLRGTATLEASTSTFSIAEVAPLQASLERALDAQVSAKLFAALNVSYRAQELRARATIAIDEGKITRSQGTIEGIAGKIALRGLAPLETQGAQTLRFGHAALGTIELGKGSADFQIEDAHTFLIERAQVESGGGTLSVGSFRVDTREPRFALDLLCRDLPLRDWLEAISDRKLSGDGKLYGHVPIRIERRGIFRVGFGAGYLFAEPGATLRVIDLEAAGNLLPKTGGSEPDSSLMWRARLEEALRELEVSKLELRLVPRGEETDLTIELAGRGKLGARQEIGGLSVRIRDFTAAVNQLLRLEQQPRKEMQHDPIFGLD